MTNWTVYGLIHVFKDGHTISVFTSVKKRRLYLNELLEEYSREYQTDLDLSDLFEVTGSIIEVFEEVLDEKE